MSKHQDIREKSNLFKEQNNKKSKEIPLETYENIESVTKVIKFLKEQQPVYELKCSKELSQIFKEHDSKRLSVSEESEENGIIERIEESDEAKIRKFDFCYKFVENIITNFNIDNYFKEKYQKSYLFNPEFNDAGISCDYNKTFKV